MCGHEITPKPRGGALAALSSTEVSGGFAARADLVFHSPNSPRSTTATHIRLTPFGEDSPSSDCLQDYVVVIHKTGDLLQAAEECGHFCEFPLKSVTDEVGAFEVDLVLAKPVSLEVGNEGIIGRRISLYSHSSPARRRLVAEGIVGFNI
ncbi:uncharacterized protein DNG_00175 [Cephalotrichum gorgonifer]|uniref:Uncharacterized protein n=1 Tax=Cephalotrichum gorgonifer TaxID=2041049 RepID=A0AAE8MNH4_9PEZI|nr:uncharacterized protein DNG_00175 [Cephalotrichum gorgonifer]